MSKSRTFTGIMWSSFQRFGTMIISFISNLILARLLTPKDFGTVGMLLFFVSISQIFIDSGFGSAIIQKKNATDKDYSTVFYLNISVSIFFYIILFFSSPWIADFYNTPILSRMLKYQGLVLLSNALYLIQATILRKKMNFKKLAIANLTGTCIASIVSIICAYFGLGVWSLVIRAILVSFVTCLCLWIISNWRPLWSFSIDIVKELFKFGGYMLLSSGLNTIGSNLQTLIIGKVFYQRTLGLYTQSMTLRNVAADSLQGIIAQVLFPDFSSMNNDSEIASKLNKSFYLISFYTTSLMLLLYFIGEPLISCLYSIKWIDAVPYFKILCIGGIFYAIQDVNYYVIAAKGKSKWLSNINLVKLPPYILGLIICGIYWGIDAVLWCIVSYALISYLMYALTATSLIKTSIKNQFFSLIKSFSFALLGLTVLFIESRILVFESDIIKIIVYTGSYCIAILFSAFVFKAFPVLYIINILKK